MNVLIVEDEVQAARRLERLVHSTIESASITGPIDTIKGVVGWLKNNNPPDVILMDIRLADGVSFEIFDRCEVTSPVIFTTAYDEYAIRAFKVNGVDYLLKPVEKEELRVALTKAIERRPSSLDSGMAIRKLAESIGRLTRQYKSRFVLKVGEHLRPLEVSDVKFFFSKDKVTFCVADDNRHHILDHSLDDLEDMLDPNRFFRINRKYLISPEALQDIINYSNSRLRLVLKGISDNDIIVARERVQDFKDWLNR